MQRAGSIFWMALETTELPRCSDAIQASSMERYKVIHESMLDQGIYLAPSGYEVGFLSTAHTNADVDQTLSALETALQKAWA